MGQGWDRQDSRDGAPQPNPLLGGCGQSPNSKNSARLCSVYQVPQGEVVQEILKDTVDDILQSNFPIFSFFLLCGGYEGSNTQPILQKTPQRIWLHWQQTLPQWVTSMGIRWLLL